MVVSSSTKNPSTPTRPPLIPSEKSTNGAGALHKKPPSKSKDVTSRYLSSPSPSPSPLPKLASSASRARRPLNHFSPPPSTTTTTTTTTTTRSLSVSFQGHSFSLHTAAGGGKPVSAKPRTPRPLARSLEGAVRLLQHSVPFDNNSIRSSSDTDSLSSSSGSSSSTQETARVPLRPVPARGISVPARFRAESGNAKKMKTKTKTKKKDSQQLPASPRRRTAAASPLKRVESSSPIRGKFSSVMNFAAEARTRGKSGEEAHALRMLYNRHLQWRYVNARADAALSAQRQSVEQNLYNTAISLSEMHDSVALKGIELQLRTQDLKLSSVLKGQMTYLEEWSLMDREHQNSMSGTIEALKASTLRLPIVGGARADIHELQNVVGSVVEVMRALGTSTHSLLLKVEGANALVSELAKAAANERALLDESKDLLSTIAAMHVKQCSLRGHILQSKSNANLV